jgi:hypothetical protein
MGGGSGTEGRAPGLSARLAVSSCARVGTLLPCRRALRSRGSISSDCCTSWWFSGCCSSRCCLLALRLRPGLPIRARTKEGVGARLARRTSPNLRGAVLRCLTPSPREQGYAATVGSRTIAARLSAGRPGIRIASPCGRGARPEAGIRAAGLARPAKRKALPRRGQSVGGRPNSANRRASKVVISAIAPASTRITSSFSARNSECHAAWNVARRRNSSVIRLLASCGP